MIFIWIPKTGGTTFASMHPEMEVITENYLGRNVEKCKDLTFGHACPKLLIKNGSIDTAVWNSHQKLALVRNPFTRFLSLYHDYRRTGRITQGMTQQQFIRAIIEMDPKPGFFNSHQLSMCAPQVEWLVPGVTILRFENEIMDRPIKKNAGNYEDGLDRRAIDDILYFYGADFVTLQYEERYDNIQ